jgi:hypothetical protein
VRAPKRVLDGAELGLVEKIVRLLYSELEESPCGPAAFVETATVEPEGR